MMREIGGYFGLEKYSGPLLHQGEIALNCGRSCLEYLIMLRKIRCIWLPDYLCSSVTDVCAKCGVTVRYYRIDKGFTPDYKFKMSAGDWLYLVDYFGQLSNEDIDIAREFCSGKLILDESQAYYRDPQNVDTLYTCRKWFGVADGAFLHTSDDCRLTDIRIPQGYSASHMGFVLGRYETSAGDFFEQSKANNARFANEGLTRMSSLTSNLLRAINYAEAASKRRENWSYLNREFGERENRLDLKGGQVPFMYPLLLGVDVAEIRTRLASKGVFVPTLWPNVLKDGRAGSKAVEYTSCMLLLPIDQRYDQRDMDYLVTLVRKDLRNE